MSAFVKGLELPQQACVVFLTSGDGVLGSPSTYWLTLAPVCGVRPAGVCLDYRRKLVNDQLKDLHQQRNVGPTLWICSIETFAFSRDKTSAFSSLSVQVQHHLSVLLFADLERVRMPSSGL